MMHEWCAFQCGSIVEAQGRFLSPILVQETARKGRRSVRVRQRQGRESGAWRHGHWCIGWCW